jgi:hypothetical protein
MDRDFKQLSSILKTLDKSIYCNEVNCFGKYTCEYYDEITPDYTLTIGHTNFTISGRDLFEHPGETGGCQFALYNSGQQYILGEFFLQNFYSVYDVKNCKLGLGKIIDIHAPVKVTDPVPSAPYATPEETAFAEKIVAGSAIAIAVMCVVASACIYRR